MAEERLQKYLARCGVASRRACETLIVDGRVGVNGQVVTELGVRVDGATDEVRLDGKVVSAPRSFAYYALNKPAGYVTTLDDPEGRPTVVKLFPHTGRRLFTVGRLDKDTTGLLLLTDDGDFANMLMHPRYHVTKTYVARVSGHPGERSLQRLRDGITLDDGPTRPAEVRRVGSGAGYTDIEVAIREGRKRQVRRMLSAIHAHVQTLQRVSFGPVSLGQLAEGTTRQLTAQEIEALRESARGTGDDR